MITDYISTLEALPISKETVDNSIKTYEALLNQRDALKGALNGIEGLCKASVVTLRNVPSLIDYLTEENKEDLLDASRYDFLPSDSTSEQEDDLRNVISSFLDNINTIRNEQLGTVLENINKYCSLNNELILLTQKFLSPSIEELSNTSSEVIPAKAREVEVTLYNFSDEAKDYKTLTFYDTKLGKDGGVELVRENLGNMVKLETLSRISEVPAEIRSLVSSLSNNVLKNKRHSYTGISLIKSLKETL